VDEEQWLVSSFKENPENTCQVVPVGMIPPDIRELIIPASSLSSSSSSSAPDSSSPVDDKTPRHKLEISVSLSGAHLKVLETAKENVWGKWGGVGAFEGYNRPLQGCVDLLGIHSQTDQLVAFSYAPLDNKVKQEEESTTIKAEPLTSSSSSLNAVPPTVDQKGPVYRIIIFPHSVLNLDLAFCPQTVVGGVSSDKDSRNSFTERNNFSLPFLLSSNQSESRQDALTVYIEATSAPAMF
jgi:hypothetical protein